VNKYTKHLHLILDAFGLCCTAVFTVFIIGKIVSALDGAYHTEIIRYNGKFEIRQHQRPRDAVLDIFNGSGEIIYVDIGKELVIEIQPYSEEVVDTREIPSADIFNANETQILTSKINYTYHTLPGYLVNYYNSKDVVTNKDADEFDIAAAQGITNINSANTNTVQTNLNNTFLVPVVNQNANTSQNSNIITSTNSTAQNNSSNNSDGGTYGTTNTPITKIIYKNQNANTISVNSGKTAITRIDIFNKNLSCLNPKLKNKNKCFWELGYMAKQFWKSSSLANKYCYSINKKYRLICANGALSSGLLTLPKK
jgi:hypothetical protein